MALTRRPGRADIEPSYEKFRQDGTRFEAALEQGLAELESRLVWRMFTFWATTAIALAALPLRR
jgi:hypothetical protein